jgi:hypothetical protein
MTVARHHAEWLSLMETSGPFLSMPVLLRVFPQGLDSRDPVKASELREVYEDWLDRGTKEPAVHHTWVRHVLTRFLEYPTAFLVEGQAIPSGTEAPMPNFGETLHPTFVLKHRDANKRPPLLIQQYEPEQDLDQPVRGKIWKASPGTRMMELLHAVDVPLGLVTNGEQWMLVHAPRAETTGFASWYADIWMQEPITLRAFHSLLHLRRFLGVAEAETLAALYGESSKDQQEVTDQLGYQVRQAVEMLVQAFDRIDTESRHTLLVGVSEQALYDSALTVMMRLVFLFSAEERGLLLLGDPLYDQHYAVSTLSELLRERADQHGEEVLERRHDAWCRLLATFRAVHGGVEHGAMRLPPYGGTLFDPDRYPFLEGRAAGTEWRTTTAKPLPINNRVVLHLLEALQMLRVKVPGGGPAEARRLSFRALDIEQIGHVYEGLLDHTAKRAGETILGLAGSKKQEPEIPLSSLEDVADKGVAPLIEFLHEGTGRSKRALKRLLEEPPTLDDHAVLIACGQDPQLAKRVKPLAALLREDSFGQLVVIPEGSVYVTSGTDRRSTGTHYTPRSLTEPVVQHTLEPLVYVGPSQGKPKDQWQLKSPKELLALTVCDMAMGSGAFLVQACRYIAERLVEAWEKIEKEQPGCFVVTPEGELSTGAPSERLLPVDSAERLIMARRFVADRCLYGVDINPMAVEMAKLSLWLITLQQDRPFTFLDHALKCGDSLLGVTSVKQIENFSLRSGERQVTFASANLFRCVEEACSKRCDLEALPSNDYPQIEAKNRLHAEAESAIVKLKTLADCLIGFELRGLDGDAYEEHRALAVDHAEAAMRQSPSEFRAHARQHLSGHRTFHWPLEFPEVFSRDGFAAFVGNPPFMGGTKLEPAFGRAWREHLVNRLADGTRGVRGTADLCAYFFLRIRQLLRPEGTAGLVATNSIAEGDTLLVGLDKLVRSGVRIIRAVPSTTWPGGAAIVVALVWLRKGSWTARSSLDGVEVDTISSALRLPGKLDSRPRSLVQNSGRVIEGAKALGMGFVLEPAEAERLIQRDSRNKQVLFPFLTGKDLNARADQSPSRWAIYFFDWPLDRNTAPKGHAGPVAADFPDCLEIVEQRVKPERLAYPPDSAWNRSLRDKWWLFGLPRPALWRAMSGMRRVLVRSAVSNLNCIAFGDTRWVFSHATKVFIYDDYRSFAFLQSDVHTVWLEEYSSRMKSDIRYTPETCFDTLVFPDLPPALSPLAERYYEYRRQVMQARQEGLTKTYTRFHDPQDKRDDIARLRELHVEVDQAVAVAYGWRDLDLDHGFHEIKQGVRYTISEFARRTVLDHLLALNHRRYEEEMQAGLHSKGPRRARKSKATPAGASTPQTDLFG